MIISTIIRLKMSSLRSFYKSDQGSMEPPLRKPLCHLFVCLFVCLFVICSIIATPEYNHNHILEICDLDAVLKGKDYYNIHSKCREHSSNISRGDNQRSPSTPNFESLPYPYRRVG